MVGGEFRGHAVLADGAPSSPGMVSLFSGGRYPAGTTVPSGRRTQRALGRDLRQPHGGGDDGVRHVGLGRDHGAHRSGMPAGDGCRILLMLSADYDATVDLDNRLAAGSRRSAWAIQPTPVAPGRSGSPPSGVDQLRRHTSWTAVPVAGRRPHTATPSRCPRPDPAGRPSGIKGDRERRGRLHPHRDDRRRLPPAALGTPPPRLPGRPRGRLDPRRRQRRT